MRLLVIRHATAEDKESFARTGKDDSQRPLTKDGKWKMERIARGIRAQVPTIDVLASSPFTRTLQTAKIVAREYDGISITTLDELTPDQPPSALLPWLRARSRDDVATVAIVGHEPYLGLLVTWLLSARDASNINIKKGGACLLELDDRPKPGDAVLLWSLTPAQLKWVER